MNNLVAISAHDGAVGRLGIYADGPDRTHPREWGRHRLRPRHRSDRGTVGASNLPSPHPFAFGKQNRLLTRVAIAAVAGWVSGTITSSPCRARHERGKDRWLSNSAATRVIGLPPKQAAKPLRPCMRSSTNIVMLLPSGHLAPSGVDPAWPPNMDGG